MVFTSLDNESTSYIVNLDSGYTGDLSSGGFYEEGDGKPLCARLESTSGYFFGTLLMATNFAVSPYDESNSDDLENIQLIIPVDEVGTFYPENTSPEDGSDSPTSLFFEFHDNSDSENVKEIYGSLANLSTVTIDSYDAVGGMVIGSCVADSLDLAYSDATSGEQVDLGNYRLEISFRVKRYADIHFYTLSYDGNNETSGSGPDTCDVMVNSSYSIAIDYNNRFLKTGYTFAGWNTESDGTGTTYQADGELIMPDHDVILYAMWEED
jgi:uncharacterized repeat protein (TIGR02543 family)